MPSNASRTQKRRSDVVVVVVVVAAVVKPILSITSLYVNKKEYLVKLASILLRGTIYESY
jgi:hypothetical protein